MLDTFSIPNANKKNNLDFITKLFTFLIFFEWLIYENLLFLESYTFGGFVFLFLINSYKLFFPIILLLYTDLPTSMLLRKTRIKAYILFFVSFFVWSIVPTILGGDIIVWLKTFPIFIFFIGVLVFFHKYPVAFLLFAKCLILYVIIALFQYFLIIVFRLNDKGNEDLWGLTGPYGILGNTSSRIYLPGQSYPIIRYCGFWKEPSIASASAFSAFFLARYLVAVEGNAYWRKASYLCLLAGLLALSNAGYLAFGLALFAGLLLINKKGYKRRFQLVILIPFTIFLIWLALFSRNYFYQNPTNNNFLLAISGIRNQEITAADFDPSGGRINLVQNALDKTQKNFIGQGMQKVGEGGIIPPAGAPMFWLLLTGFPGLFFLLVMIAIIIISLRKINKQNPNIVYLSQAFFAVLGQQLAYGTWMDPKFIILAAVVLLGLNIEKSL